MGDLRAGRRASVTSRPRSSGLTQVISSPSVRVSSAIEDGPDEPMQPFSKSFSRGSALRGSLRSSIRASRSSLEAGRPDSAPFELDDQTWALKRKKIGLSRRTGRTMVKLTEEEQLRQLRLSFIGNNFHRKECVLYQPRADGTGRCHCGAPPAEHRNAAQASIAEEEWSASNAIQEFKTNAFGQVEFVNEDTGSSKPSKYVRLSDTTPISHVITLLVDHWQLCHPNRPSLVISILGGAKNFRLDGRKKQIFNDGLLKAARSTNAWLITGGFNMGYMKVIGDTINQGQYLITGDGGKMTRGIRCLGLCSWGYIRNRELLINKDTKGFNHASYKTSSIVRTHEPVSLNGDHTHFLLVDDGMRGYPYGAAELRAKLEERIADPGVGGLGIPVILLILEGGLGVIQDVLHSLRRGIPVVVIAGTGRAADIIAFAQYEICKRNGKNPKFRSGTRRKLQEMLEEAYNKSYRGTKEQLYAYIDKLEECMEFVDLINVFDLNSDQELDAVILNALMKESGITEDSLLPMEPLQLALMWDRLDMAEKIFSGRHDWPPGCLDDMLTETLLSSKVDFFNLLVLNVVFLKDYLNVRRLRLLYNLASSTRSPFRRALERLGVAPDSGSIHLRHVDRLLKHVLRRHEKSLYEDDDPRPTHREPKLDEMQFTEPWDELFLWAVLNCRQSVARHVWSRTSSPVTFAVMATAVYRHYHDSTSSDNNHMRDMFDAYFKEFKLLSVEMMHLCYERNSLQAVSLVERRYDRLGDMSVTLLAMFADNRAFLATPCCYDSISQTWMGAIRKASTTAICVAIFCPILVWTRAVRFLPLGDSGGELGPFQKLLAFYKAPFTKLVANAMSYAAFLVLYTYMILFDFRFEMQLTEKIVIFWIFTMMLDVLRQITTYPSETLPGKLSDWISSIWNKFDFLTFLLALLAFCLRMFTVTFAYGRIAYSLNTCILYIRAFRFYHIVFKLGPKLVILYRMIDEVFNFMLLLVVFILGYGVAAQALLYPVRPFYLHVFKDVFMLPYWQMYGELQLETTVAPEAEVCYESRESGRICEDISHYAQVVPPMLAIFLLIGNVMLLNLLIAVFSNVFEKVRENSMEIWKYEMFRLVKEYEEKPGLAPPLVLLELIWIAAKKTWKVCCRRRKENLKLYLQRHLANLAVFERECMAYFLQREKVAKANQTDEKLARIEERLAYIAMLGEGDMERVEDILMAVDQGFGGKKRSQSQVTLVAAAAGESSDSSDDHSAPVAPMSSRRMPSAHARLGSLERRLSELAGELGEQRASTERLLQKLLTRLPPPGPSGLQPPPRSPGPQLHTPQPPQPPRSPHAPA